MAKQFGEQVSNTTAAAQASSATAYMRTETLQRMNGDKSNGPIQQQAVKNELHKREAN